MNTFTSVFVSVLALASVSARSLAPTQAPTIAFNSPSPTASAPTPWVSTLAPSVQPPQPNAKTPSTVYALSPSVSAKAPVYELSLSVSAKAPSSVYALSPSVSAKAPNVFALAPTPSSSKSPPLPPRQGPIALPIVSVKAPTPAPSTIAPTAPAPAPAHHHCPCPHNNDVDILNFALNLECLEAEFYSWAVYGVGLNKTLYGHSATSVGGQKANLSATVYEYASQIAQDEIHHVAFLREVLGKSAVDCPSIDIGSSFEALGNLTLGANSSFSPYSGDINFLLGAYIFEDVGVTAYAGASVHICDKEILLAVAKILGVEAYHAGSVRTLLSMYDMNASNVTDSISKIRSNVSNAGFEDDLGLPKLVPTDENSLVFSRSVESVLAVTDLFFPKGINV